MKKLAVGILALVVSATVQAANTLHVKAGQTQTLEGSQMEWVLDELVLEDNATLVIPADKGQVQIDAARALIGAGAQIVAQGVAGSGGQPGANSEGQADKCVDGVTGGHGQHGAVGGDGVALNLTLRIARLGSLTINTQGGGGGQGGAGGKGQDAGEFDTCSPPKGGDGGRGGDGGDGGNGGHVRVFYTLLPESGINGGIGDQIKVNADGGKGAVGGEGGKGGEGGPGKFINMKTLSGSKKWVGGGKAGGEGVAGKAGRDGVKGQILVQQDLRSRMDELMQKQSQQVEAMSTQMAAKLAEGQAATQSTMQQSMQALNQEVDALKLTVGGLATQEMVQKQGADRDARLDKFTQMLETLNKRLDQLERKVDALGAARTKPASPTPSAP